MTQFVSTMNGLINADEIVETYSRPAKAKGHTETIARLRDGREVRLLGDALGEAVVVPAAADARAVIVWGWREKSGALQMDTKKAQIVAWRVNGRDAAPDPVLPMEASSHEFIGVIAPDGSIMVPYDGWYDDMASFMEAARDHFEAVIEIEAQQ